MIKQFQLILIVTLAFNAIANAQTNNAYGDNQKEVEPGVFAIFSGDVNQDGVIDVLDQGMLDNGDAVVDLLDQGFLDNNMFNFVGVISPLTGSRIASPQQGNRRNTINTIQNKN
jgi:hypothetical protein